MSEASPNPIVLSDILTTEEMDELLKRERRQTTTSALTSNAITALRKQMLLAYGSPSTGLIVYPTFSIQITISHVPGPDGIITEMNIYLMTKRGIEKYDANAIINGIVEMFEGSAGDNARWFLHSCPDIDLDEISAEMDRYALALTRRDDEPSPPKKRGKYDPNRWANNKPWVKR